MKFTNTYVQPLCSPTRATLMTGKDAPARLHMHQAITGHSAENPVIPKQARPTADREHSVEVTEKDHIVLHMTGAGGFVAVIEPR